MATRSALEQSMEALGRDVSFLGRVLGEVLREQGGDALFEAVEGLRQACRRMRRDGSPDAEAEVRRRVDELPLARALDVVRAFTMYFHLINTAEENHRLRRIAEREREDAPAPRYESIAIALQSLHEAGVSVEDVHSLIGGMSIRPVFTAHPTEARRMAILRHLRRIAELVTHLSSGELPPQQRDRLTDRLYAEVTCLWQTNELRTRQQTVVDEVRTGLYFFDESVFAVTAEIYRDMRDALRRHYPALGTVPVFLTFGSWIGGDRDGNPNVTPQVTETALRMHKALALTKYMERVEQLYAMLTPSATLAGASRELTDSLERDVAEFGSVGDSMREQRSDEPYRQKLGFIAMRLRETYERNGSTWTGEALDVQGETEGPAYDGAEALLADLDVMARSLSRHQGGRIAEDALQELIWQVRVFGFHLARLDIRQHRNRHLEALDALLDTRDLASRFSDLDEERKLEVLGEAMSSGQVRADFVELPEPVRETLEVFRTVARMQGALGRGAVDTYIVSFTQEASDLLGVLYLARLAGLVDLERGVSHLQVVPLFETEADLGAAPRIMGALYDNPLYRQQLEAWQGEQEVMVGYSDSDKDAGYLTSNWWLYRAQRELAAQAEAAGVKLTFFHGRGGAIGRGGGPLHRAVLSQPAGTVKGRIKVTEQGEVLFTRYANPGIARRHLEQVVNAVIRASSPELVHSPAQAERWETAAHQLSRCASAAYHSFVSDDPEFLRFFEEGTPLRSILRLRIASRPATRRTGPLRLEDLRAIPWVFAWTQARYGVPGWFGLGTALERFMEAQGPGELQRMYRDWPFFRWLIDAAQISLGKADLQVARLYAALATDQPARERYGRILDDEFCRTVEAVNRVVGQERLLDSWPLLQRSIELRNPYVDPMSYIQVRCIRELRPEPDKATADLLRSIIDRSVTGIAAGLQNTG